MGFPVLLQTPSVRGEQERRGHFAQHSECPGRLSCSDELVPSPESLGGSQTPASPKSFHHPESLQVVEFVHTEHLLYAQQRASGQKWTRNSQTRGLCFTPEHPRGGTLRTEPHPENRATPSLAQDQGQVTTITFLDNTLSGCQSLRNRNSLQSHFPHRTQVSRGGPEGVQTWEWEKNNNGLHRGSQVPLPDYLCLSGADVRC